MTIQKVISKPSAASQKRGRKAMASLSRKVNYLESEVGRESAVLLDQEGNEISAREAIDRMGGKNANYVEIVSDASGIETATLLARRPEDDPREVMADHFRVQLSKLDKQGILALHQEPDQSWHVHLLLHGQERDYGRLEGRHGKLQRTWDETWRNGQDRDVVDARAKKEADRIRIELVAMKAEEKVLNAERKTLKNASPGEKRMTAREDHANRAAAYEERLHGTHICHLDALYRSRGQHGGLEHQVELATEESRHVGDSRRIERDRLGFDRSRAIQLNPLDVSGALTRLGVHARGGDREAFRHLSTAQRKEVREAALRRELEVLKKKHGYELNGPGVDRNALMDRHGAENSAALLRFEGACLRDREEALRGGLTKSVAMRPERKKLMAQRHAIECLALHGQATGMGRIEPKSEALRKLEMRQAKERDTLRSEPGTKLAGKAQHHLRSIGRKMATVPSKALKKVTDEIRNSAGYSHNHDLPHEADYLESFAQRTLASAGTTAAKIAMTAVMESAMTATHLAMNLARATAVLGKAIAVSIVDPAAAVKAAGRGLGQVGQDTWHDLAKDTKDAATNIGIDAKKGSKNVAGQMIRGITSIGTNMAPAEVRVAIATATALVRADLIGAGSAAGLGAGQVIGLATKSAHGQLGALANQLNLAVKIPSLELASKIAKLASELGAFAAASKTNSNAIDIDL